MEDLSISPDNQGNGFPLKQDITVLPADNSCCDLSGIILMAAWTDCLVMDFPPCMQHNASGIRLNSDEIQMICDSFEIDIMKFRELMAADLIDPQKLKDEVNRMKDYRRKKNGRKDETGTM